MSERCIYLLRNLVNRKIYIGKTESPLRYRWHRHIREAMTRHANGVAIHHAIRKYGSASFSVERLCSNISKHADLAAIERLYIRMFRANDPRFGYNMTDGGDGGGARGPCSVKMRAHLEKLWDAKRGKRRPDAAIHLREFMASLTPEELSNHAKKARASVKRPIYVTANLVPGLRNFSPERRSEIVKKGHATRKLNRGE